MCFRLKKAAIGLGMSLALGGAGLENLCGAAESSPLRITGSSGATLLPNTNSNQMQVERLLKSLGPSRGPSVSTDTPWSVPPPASSSTPFRNPNLQKYIDQQRNWIFQTPEMQYQSYLNNDSLSSKVADPSTPSKTTVEQYWEFEKSKVPTTPREVDDLSSSGTGLDSSSSSSGVTGFENHSLTTLPSSQTGSFTNSFTSFLGGSLSGVSSLTPQSSFGISPLYETVTMGLTKDSLADRAKTDDFERILRPSSLAAPRTLGNDPINSALDATRQNVQPILPSSLDEFASAPGTPLAPDVAKSPTFMGSLDFPAPKPAGSSLNPAFANGESTWSKPKPAVLEFPKRRF